MSATPKGRVSGTSKGDVSAKAKAGVRATLKGGASAAPKGDVSAAPKGDVSTTPKGAADDLPVIVFEDAAAFERWILAHPEAKGVWAKIAKKGQAIASMSNDQAIEVALCTGWIDGQRRGFDDCYFLQRYTPRRPKGLWSKINIGKVGRLTAEGRMREGGLREVAAAKADGRWDAAYDPASTAEIPDDLAAALAAQPEARAFFEQIDRTNRYAVLWRVMTAKTPKTRANRIEKLVAMLARGEKVHG
ncbi:YdeI/OmpD-associated family protein [Lysobacter capsici]|uniref:YdeI/OmpD-associated family protein n=1 Tax=Lysobacter capsici TaxID=435897 RepID=UPI00287B604D|nr:YdeI/OmpD-associated family protein [Lysobacter capsici]WND78608.1 YdeI/OmpD-associated family protein [Lysobacter capsici]WND83803.1 YdeI/OmpD-associated family protein [Lysobacter capsici]